MKSIESCEAETCETASCEADACDTSNCEPGACETVKLKSSCEAPLCETDVSAAPSVMRYIIIAIVVSVFLRIFIFGIAGVSGKSMYPTLNDGDKLIVSKLPYTPKQGDIIIFDSHYNNKADYYDTIAEEKQKKELSLIDKIMNYFHMPTNCYPMFYVKRIIATEGQTVDLKDGKVYIDGEELCEAYCSSETYATDDVKYPVTVDEDCVFVMGDNRTHSLDSRSEQVGQVKLDAIMGQSILRYFPFNQFGTVE